MRVLGATDVNWAAGSTVRIGATFPIFLALVNGKNVIEGPTLCPVLGPAVVIALYAPRPNHGVDAAAATQDVAKGHIELRFFN